MCASITKEIYKTFSGIEGKKNNFLLLQFEGEGQSQRLNPTQGLQKMRLMPLMKQAKFQEEPETLVKARQIFIG